MRHLVARRECGLIQRMQLAELPRVSKVSEVVHLFRCIDLLAHDTKPEGDVQRSRYVGGLVEANATGQLELVLIHR